MNYTILLIGIIFLWMIHTWMISSSFHTQQQHDASFNNFLQQNTNDAPSSSSGSSYSLAKSQSFDFFTTITNTEWKLKQEHHAKLFPNYYSNLQQYSHGPGDKGKITMLRNSPKWYGQNFQVEFICPLARRLPSDSMMDGPKWVSL